jgi:predicted nucleotidyltransferase component of viral defense system
LANARHRARLIAILKDIYADPELRTALGFKGGTVAMLFYDLPRFSVDLDFDLLKEGVEDRVFEKVQAILRTHGNLREAGRRRFTLFFLVSYECGQHNVKVEISRRATVSRFAPRSYLGIPMLVMTKEGMLAGKLSALITRRKPAMRDVFDLWFFRKNHWPVNDTVFQKKTGLSLKDGLKVAIQQVQAIPRNQILQGLGEMLDQGQKDRMREKLAEETVFYLQLLAESHGH